ncbi:MAG: pilus assembly protein [Rhodospirillaceae bacterium]|nr:pilus assembly protein [Rhodospirillales bacterium]
MLRRLFQDRRGATAVEFALVLPVFLVLLLGTMELGRVMWAHSTLQFAAEEASRYAIAHSSASNAEITAKAQAHLVGLNSGEVTVNVTNNAATVTVQLTHNFQFATAGLLPYGNMALSATSRFPRN